jgi:tetratricopeptide (TPR) repeat protein
MLRHLAFFEELAKTKETDANWRSTSAGLVVLRLVDQWMAGRPGDSASWSITAVREAVAQIEETTPVRRILASAVDAIAESTPENASAVIPRLMAYAKSLEYDARWRLAVDVYETILRHADPGVDADVVITAHVQTSTCLRALGDFDGALESSRRAQAVATAVNDAAGQLRGRLVEARVSVSRGNFPLAAKICDEVIEASERHGLLEMKSRALQDRAGIAGMTGEFERAIQFAYAGLPGAASERDRETILLNIATGFSELGLIDVARDAYLVVLATTQDQYLRWNAAMNMMEIAGRQRSEPVFDRYRRELVNVQLTSFLHAKFLITLGNGYRQFGKRDLAISSLEEALGYSREKGLNHLVFEAEQALATARAESRAPSFDPAGTVPAGIAGVATAIRAMRETVGSGA